LALAVKAIAAEVWQPTNSKRKRLRGIVDAWRRMTQPTYGERRSVAPHLSSAYARNRFKSKGRDDPVYLAHYDLRIERSDKKHSKLWLRIPHRPRKPIWLPLRMSKQSEATASGRPYGKSVRLTLDKILKKPSNLESREEKTGLKGLFDVREEVKDVKWGFLLAIGLISTIALRPIFCEICPSRVWNDFPNPASGAYF
jgi:hypothetical protein